MREEWQEPPPDHGGRLKRYDIAAWLRELVEMNLLQRAEAAEAARVIRVRFGRGERPWLEN